MKATITVLRRLILSAAVLAGAVCFSSPLLAQQTGSPQDNYVASLRDQLQRNARYPTGREASLRREQGEVSVRFALARDGSVRDAQLVRSSDSMLLDGAALAVVRRTSYPAFATALYPGQASHDFQVTLAYAPAGQPAGEGAARYVQATVRAVAAAAKP